MYIIIILNLYVILIIGLLSILYRASHTCWEKYLPLVYNSPFYALPLIVLNHALSYQVSIVGLTQLCSQVVQLRHTL